jgi:hypothetical protein
MAFAWHAWAAFAVAFTMEAMPPRDADLIFIVLLVLKSVIRGIADGLAVRTGGAYYACTYEVGPQRTASSGAVFAHVD